MYAARTPPVVKALASQLVWSGPPGPAESPTVYLTFDDGPHPSITREAMAVLGNVPALFFCVGANVERHAEVVGELQAAGHAVGNHAHRHESGWETRGVAYLRSYLACERALRSASGSGSVAFRPPYGRITRSQAAAIGRRSEIVMWDVLSGDFDVRETADSCLARLQRATRPGSVVVFHDSEKAASRMLGALPRYVAWLAEQGYTAKPLPIRPLQPH